MNIIDKLERIINEATVTGGLPDSGRFISKGVSYGATASDDDHPTGNILMGVPYTRKTVETPGGSFRMYIPREEWQWDEFERAKGMEFIRNYHPSLADNKILQSLYGKRVFRYSRKKEDPDPAMAKLNIERGKDPEATMSGIEDIEGEENIAKGTGEGVTGTIKEDILIKIKKQLGEGT